MNKGGESHLQNVSNFTDMERRDFVMKWSRWALLGGMLASAGYLAVSGRVSATASCDDTGKCGNCSRYASCKDSGRQKTLNHGK
jgi:hypothetical protein